MMSRARRRRRHHTGMKWIVAILGLLVVLAASAGGAGAIWALRIYDSAPKLASLHPRKQTRVTRVYAADGSRLGVIHSDTIREPVTSDKIAQALKDATVAIEDSENGLRSAHAAGMRVIAIPNPHFPPDPSALALADLELPDLDALTADAVR